MPSSRPWSFGLMASVITLSVCVAGFARSDSQRSYYVTAPCDGANDQDVRVVALSNGTEVILDEAKVATLDAGESFVFLPLEATAIETSAPVAVFEHANLFDAERDVVQVPPVDLAHAAQKVFCQIAPGQLGSAFVLVQTHDVDAVRLDGQPLSQAQRSSVPGHPEWTGLRVGQLAAGAHAWHAPAGLVMAVISSDKNGPGSFAYLPASAPDGPTNAQVARYAQGRCQADADCGTRQWCETAEGICRAQLEVGQSMASSYLGRASINGNCTPANAGSMCVSGSCNTQTNTCALPNAQPCPNATICASNVCAADHICGVPDLAACTRDMACRSGSCLEGFCQVSKAKIEGSGLLDSCESTPGPGAQVRGAIVLFALVTCVLWRRRRRQVATLGAILFVALWSPGRAEAVEAGFALERVTLAPANSRWFAADSLVSGPASLNPNFGIGANSIALRLDGAWAHQPLVMKFDARTLASVVEDQVALTLHGSWNPLRALRLAVDFPLQVYARGGMAVGDGSVVLPPPDTVAAGDLAAAATYVFDTVAADALRFGLSLRFRFPTGQQDDFMSDGTTSGALLLTMAGDVDYLAYSLTIGGRLRSKQAFAGDTLGSEVTATPAIGLQTRDRTWLVGLEVPMALNVVDATPFSQAGLAADPVFGLHWWPMPQLGLQAGVGSSLSTAVGEARWRVLAGLQWFPLLDTTPPPPPPSPPPIPPPPPPPPADTDTDGDHVPDPNDYCSHGEPGDPNLLGCFAMDTDKDGVVDLDDHCPQEAGTVEYQGCPPPTKVVVQEDRITVNDKIDFEVNQDTLKPASLPTLDDIVKVMQSHPQIKVLQVQGHTDTSGNAKKNRQLSEKRAASVVQYLVAHGVATERLQAKGFGSDQPLVPNDTSAHRSTNRRVDFIIVDGAGSAAVAPGGAGAAQAPAKQDVAPAGAAPVPNTQVGAPVGASPAPTTQGAATLHDAAAPATQGGEAPVAPSPGASPGAALPADDASASPAPGTPETRPVPSKDAVLHGPSDR